MYRICENCGNPIDENGFCKACGAYQKTVNPSPAGTGRPAKAENPAPYAGGAPAKTGHTVRAAILILVLLIVFGTGVIVVIHLFPKSDAPAPEKEPQPTVYYAPQSIMHSAATIDGESFYEVFFAWDAGAVRLESSAHYAFNKYSLNVSFNELGECISGSMSDSDGTFTFSGDVSFIHENGLLAGVEISGTDLYQGENRKKNMTASFDRSGRITGVSSFINDIFSNGVSVYYDDNGNCSSAEYDRFPDDPLFQYTYNDAGQLIRCEVGPKADLTANGTENKTLRQALDYEYDKNRLSIVRWNREYMENEYLDLLLRFTYDDNGLLSDISIDGYPDEPEPEHVKIEYVEVTPAQYACWQELKSCAVDYFGIGECFFGASPFDSFMELLY